MRSYQASPRQVQASPRGSLPAQASPRVSLDEPETPAEAKRKRDENRQLLAQVAEELPGLKTAVASMRTCEEHVLQNAQVIVDLRHMLNTSIAEVQSLKASQQNALQAQQEMVGFRKLVSALQGELQAMKADRQQLADKQEIGALRQEFSGMRQQLAGKQDLDALKQQIAGSSSSRQGEVDSLKQQLTSNKQQLESLTQKMASGMQNQAGKQELEALKQKLTADSRDLQRVQQEFAAQKQEVSGYKQQINALKEGTQSKNELVSLRSKVELTALEFGDLKKQIYDKGLLAPANEGPPSEEPPVGTLELGEDVFTARLLLKLGFMKGKMERKAAFEEELAEGDAREMTLDSDSMLSASDNELDDDGVHGLEVPEIGHNDPGFLAVTTGWVFICISTLAVQILIVIVMLSNGASQGEGCFHEVPSWTSWWLLHISKAFAIFVAGLLLGKELMDTVNYWMVSELLEAHRSCEVIISALIRIMLILLISAANVIIFTYMKSPSSVWINMTALGFIGELGGGVLDIAKRGVFGHSISKTITPLNYQLTFTHAYPRWFTNVRNMTVFVTVIFIAVFSTFCFITPDNLCDGAEGANHTHGQIHPLIAGHPHAHPHGHR